MRSVALDLPRSVSSLIFWELKILKNILFGVFTGGDARVSLNNLASRETDGLMLRLRPGSDEQAFSSAICWTTFLGSAASAVATATLSFALWSWV